MKLSQSYLMGRIGLLALIVAVFAGFVVKPFLRILSLFELGTYLFVLDLPIGTRVQAIACKY